jgi:hypothetical protein
LNGRRCGALDFSNGAPHSWCMYDKTKEITRFTQGLDARGLEEERLGR